MDRPGPTSTLLADLAVALADLPGPAEVLLQLGTALVGRVADRVVVDLLEPPDLVTRVAVLGPDGPSQQSGDARPRRSSAARQGLLAALLASPHRQLRLDAAAIRRLADSGDLRGRQQAELALALGTQDLLVVGLPVRDQVVGVLTLLATEGPLSDEALALVPQVVAVAALALDASGLREVQDGLATAMQTTLLPPLPGLPGLALAARYAPARQALGVGGDWYDAFALPGGSVGLAIGDATGHDTAAIAQMATLRNVLRALALDRDEPPGATLARLDRTVAALGEEASATCLYARLDPEPGGGHRLRWSSAGHLPPLLRTAAGTRLLDTAEDLMLGVDPARERTEQSVVVRAGDRLLLCTDGLVEERRRSLDEGLAALVAAVDGFADLDLETLVDRLVARRGASEDDAALLAVQL